METKDKLRSLGLKATPQRKIVYEAMKELGHSPIDDIIFKVQQFDPDITISTVYRILDLFCKSGLISKLNHPDGKNWFDITPSEHHHIYIDNKKIIDFEAVELTESIKIKLEKLFEELNIEKVSIQITASTKNNV